MRMFRRRLSNVPPKIVEALQEAHGRGFLHRDLKSANVMVTGSLRRPLAAQYRLLLDVVHHADVWR